MGYDLEINTHPELTRLGPDKVNWDTLNSFCVIYGYNLTPLGQALQVNINRAYAAVYASHTSAIPIQALTPKGPVFNSGLGKDGQVLVLKDAVGDLKLQGLNYFSVDDIHAANQAGQLHLFRFDAASKPVKEWVDDSRWNSGFVEPVADKTASGHPFWKRYCAYRKEEPSGRYCSATMIRKIANNEVGALGIAMPFRPASLFSAWLNTHLEAPIDLTIEAKAGSTSQWKHNWASGAVKPQSKVSGLGAVCQGAFLRLELSALMSDRWTRMFGVDYPDADYELSRLLMDVVSQAAPNPMTIGQFADTRTTSVIPQPAQYAHEVFTIRVN